VGASVEPIAVAGATGFVGQALMYALGGQQKLIGLSRSVPEQSPHPNWQWRSCNLFNLLNTEQALAGAKTAFYLVHSMMPPETLAQGHFYDMDLICADNFARAAKSQGVEHIVYLSGIIPNEKKLSPHLRSRLEVEKTLAAHGVPVTTLRAGLVIGPGGSSYLMMARLAQRLPIMVTPLWTRSKTQPIALPDVISLLRYAMDHRELSGQAYDVACPDVLSYADMLRQVAAQDGRTLRIFQVPIKSVRLSLWWVSWITQTSMQLVVPLVQSLRHTMVAGDGLRLQRQAGLQAMSFTQSIDLAARSEPTPPLGKRQAVPRRAQRSVLSVQRLPLPKGKDAIWVSSEYARWLPQFLWPMLRVDVDPTDAQLYRFCLPFGKRALLELRFAPKRSSESRQLFYVSGGMLACNSSTTEPGRFEFRTTLDNSYVLSAIHDFIPRLPWYFYKFTQAVAHRIVMFFFGRHLGRLAKRSAGGAASSLL
jgi:uncharacterized protein YbjT (DUF2867 family)